MSHLYSIRQWTLPLPAPLCARIAAQLRSSDVVDGRANGHDDAHATPQYELRCEWEIEVEADTPVAPSADHSTSVGSSNGTAASDANGTSASTVQPNGDGQASSSSLAAPSASSSSSPAPLLSLAEFQSAVHFLASFFPFASFEALVGGLVRFAALWSKLSRGGGGGGSTAAAPPVAHAPPRISRVFVRGELLLRGNVLLEVSRETTSDDEQLLGRDVNAWGDVDILIEVPPTDGADADDGPPADTTVAASCSSCTSTCTSLSPPPSAGLYCLNLLPLQRIPLHVHQVLSESELVFSHGVVLQDGLLPADFGEVHSWGRLAHTYFNPTPTVQRILCIDVPMFIPSDEIIVSAADHALRRPESTNMPWCLSSTWTFPGGWHEQHVTLTTDQTRFEEPHAVLLFAFASDGDVDDANGAVECTSSSNGPPPPSPSGASDERLLFVRHSKRGWELPGGKVDSGESPSAAVVREALEEAGATLRLESLKLVAQYVLDRPGAPKHVKSVFVARVAKMGEELKHETMDARLLAPPIWQTMFDPPVIASSTSAHSPATAPSTNGTDSAATTSSPHALQFSSILRDNVYPLCLKLTLAALRFENPTR
jgi:8-oxo-dGTP pyrophosphatase MutT (NUDIX family)